MDNPALAAAADDDDDDDIRYGRSQMASLYIFCRCVWQVVVFYQI